MEAEDNYAYDEEEYLKEQWDGQIIELKLDVFRLQYPIIGCMCSVALFLNLLELLVSSYCHWKLLALGYISCCYVTCANLMIFSMFIITNEANVDWESAVNNKWVANVILGFGAATYTIYLVLAMLKSLKGNFWFILFDYQNQWKMNQNQTLL